MLVTGRTLNLLTRMHEEGEEAERERRGRSHSQRLAILAVLSRERRELTPAQIRAELPDTPPLGNVNYHLRVLEQAGLVSENGGCYSLP